MSGSYPSSILLRFADREQRTINRLALSPESFIRWGAWSRDGKEAVLVGSNGQMMRYYDDRFYHLTSETKEHLRCASYNPKDFTIFSLWNKGTIILTDNDSGSRELDT